MSRKLRAIPPTLALAAARLAFAGPLETRLEAYAQAAPVADPALPGFSAARGAALHTRSFSGGKPDTPACESPHGADPRRAGRTLSGKPIEPMELSAAPTRYQDAAKIEKWFRRKCREVIGRECSPQEKGDWLTWMESR